MLEIARKFLKEKCDERGNIAKAQINEMVEAGIKELKSKYLERKKTSKTAPSLLQKKSTRILPNLIFNQITSSTRANPKR